MPRVSAVIWFNENKERDWRVNSSQASLDAYRKVVSSTLWGGTESPVVKEAAPVVKELDVVPVVAPAPAAEPAPATESAPAAAPESTPAPAPVSKPARGKSKHSSSLRRRGRKGVTLRGRVTYRLSRPGLVRIVLRRAHGRPLVFTANQSAGHKRVALSQLVGARRLARGHYSVSVVAYSVSGNHSAARHHGFRLAPRHKH